MTSSKSIFAWVLFFLAAAVVIATPASAAGDNPAAGSGEPTCVPTLQRLLSCLDFIEHGTDAIPPACCAQLNSTVAEQPCCLMHVLRGNVVKLIGQEFDSSRAMVNVTTKCLGDASIIMSITRSCAGKPLPPLTPEYPFTTALPPPSTSGARANRLRGSPFIALSFVLLASIVYGALAVQQI